MQPGDRGTPSLKQLWKRRRVARAREKFSGRASKKFSGHASLFSMSFASAAAAADPDDSDEFADLLAPDNATDENDTFAACKATALQRGNFAAGGISSTLLSAGVTDLLETRAPDGSPMFEICWATPKLANQSRLLEPCKKRKGNKNSCPY